MTSPKLDLSIRLAKHLLTLPEGSWPQTAQAEEQLAESLPRNLSVEQVLDLAARQVSYIHSSRQDWLQAKTHGMTIDAVRKTYPAAKRP